MKENDIVLPDLVYDVYADSFVFEAVLIIAVAWYLWYKFTLWFGGKKKLFDFKKLKKVVEEI